MATQFKATPEIESQYARAEELYLYLAATSEPEHEVARIEELEKLIQQIFNNCRRAHTVFLRRDASSAEAISIASGQVQDLANRLNNLVHPSRAPLRGPSLSKPVDRVAAFRAFEASVEATFREQMHSTSVDANWYQATKLFHLVKTCITVMPRFIPSPYGKTYRSSLCGYLASSRHERAAYLERANQKIQSELAGSDQPLEDDALIRIYIVHIKALAVLRQARKELSLRAADLRTVASNMKANFDIHYTAEPGPPTYTPPPQMTSTPTLSTQENLFYRLLQIAFAALGVYIMMVYLQETEY